MATSYSEIETPNKSIAEISKEHPYLIDKVASFEFGLILNSDNDAINCRIIAKKLNDFLKGAILNPVNFNYDSGNFPVASFCFFIPFSESNFTNIKNLLFPELKASTQVKLKNTLIILTEKDKFILLQNDYNM